MKRPRDYASPSGQQSLWVHAVRITHKRRMDGVTQELSRSPRQARYLFGWHRKQHGFQRSQPTRAVLGRHQPTTLAGMVRASSMPQIAPDHHERPRRHGDFDCTGMRSGITFDIRFIRKILIGQHPWKISSRPGVTARQYLCGAIL